MHFQPDYQSYSYDELVDARRYIDVEAYPERTALLDKLINEFDHSKAIASDSHVYEDNPYSTLPARLGALVIDAILLLLISFLLGLVIGNQGLLQTIINAGIYIMYRIIMHGLYGQTVGKMMLNLKVMSFKSSDESENKDSLLNMDIKQAMLREIVTVAFNIGLIVLLVFNIVFTGLFGQTFEWLLYIIGGITILNFVWILSDTGVAFASKKSRAWHDLIANTVVVKI